MQIYLIQFLNICVEMHKMHKMHTKNDKGVGEHMISF